MRSSAFGRSSGQRVPNCWCAGARAAGRLTGRQQLGAPVPRPRLRTCGLRLWGLCRRKLGRRGLGHVRLRCRCTNVGRCGKRRRRWGRHGWRRRGLRRRGIVGVRRLRRSCHRRRVRVPGQLRMRFEVRAVRSEIPAMLLGGAIDVVVPVHSLWGRTKWARFALIGRRLAQTRLCGQQNGRWDHDEESRQDLRPWH